MDRASRIPQVTKIPHILVRVVYIRYILLGPVTGRSTRAQIEIEAC